MKGSKALLVVDLQNDFCPGGALPVKDGDKIVAPINQLVVAFQERDLPVAFTRDWHPRGHCSFREGGGKWPPHCIQGTKGAEFHPSLSVPPGAIVISKGTCKDQDAYSGFQETDLAERLHELATSELYVCGLATDVCVKETVLDALKHDFVTYLVTDATKGINLHPADSSKAITLMIASGAKTVTSTHLLKELNRRVAVSSSS